MTGSTFEKLLMTFIMVVIAGFIVSACLVFLGKKDASAKVFKGTVKIILACRIMLFGGVMIKIWGF